MSMIILTLLIIYGLFKGYTLIYRLSPKVTMQVDIIDLDSEPEFIPTTLGFDFAFGINEPLDPRYG